MTRKHLIIGCGSAALSALEKIRSIAPADQIRLVSREDCPPYSPTALPYLLAGRIAEDALWLRPEEYFGRLNATLATGKEVVQVLPASKEVLYRDGDREDFDSLLIATGAEPVRPPINGLAETGFLGFRTVDDYRSLISRLDGQKRVAVLGGGLIGMEIAGALLERGHQVDIIEKEARLLPLYFDEQAEEIIRTAFKQAGAQVHTAVEATEVQRRNGKVEIGLASGEALTADVLVTAVGVRSQKDLVTSSGLEVDRGIVVDEHMQTSAADIYAAGDVAEAPGFFGERGANPILPSAVTQGRVAGSAMAGEPEPYAGWLLMNVFNFAGCRAFSVGLSLARGEGHQAVTATDANDHSYRKLVMRDGKIVGAMFLGVDVDPGVFAYLIRRQVDIADYQSSLLEEPQVTGRYLMMSTEKRETAVVE